MESTQDLIDYYENTLQNGVPAKSRKKFTKPKTWNPSLAKYFKRLQNLEDITISFNLLELDQQKINQFGWFLDVMKMLPGLERLRNVLIDSNSGEAFRSIEQKISDAVLEFRNVREISVFFFDIVRLVTPEYLLIRQAVEKVNQRQATRCDLMF